MRSVPGVPGREERGSAQLSERRVEPRVTRGRWGMERTASEAGGLGGPAGRQGARLPWTTSSSGPTSESGLRPPWTLPRLVGKMPRAPALPPVCSPPDKRLSAESTELGPPALTAGV